MEVQGKDQLHQALLKFVPAYDKLAASYALSCDETSAGFVEAMALVGITQFSMQTSSVSFVTWGDSSYIDHSKQAIHKGIRFLEGKISHADDLLQRKCLGLMLFGCVVVCLPKAEETCLYVCFSPSNILGNPSK